MTSKKFLVDVAAIRLFLILMLVFYHAFAIYTGGWEPPYSNFPSNNTYYWMGLWSHGFQLEAMVFISGLLWGYSQSLHPKVQGIVKPIGKKAKRILLPSMLFSVIYYWMFYDMNEPWYVIVLSILNGCGHLWFLPMIFWCFVSIVLINHLLRFTPPDSHLLTIIVALSILFPPIDLPFRLSSFVSYFPFFFMGVLVYNGKHGCFQKQLKRIRCWGVVALLAIYTIGVAIEAYIQGYVVDGTFQKVIRLMGMRIVHIVAVVCMIGAIYTIANNSGLKKKLSNIPVLITLSGYCYGVYIYQQFILKVLYYCTNLPFVVSPVILPWIGFSIALLTSLMFCHFTLKTKVGKFLIG